MQIETWGNNFNCKKRESNKKSDEKYVYNLCYNIELNVKFNTLVRQWN